MKNLYKIKLHNESLIEAEDENEALNKYFEEIENEPQQTLGTFMADNIIVKQINENQSRQKRQNKKKSKKNDY